MKRDEAYAVDCSIGRRGDPLISVDASSALAPEGSAEAQVWFERQCRMARERLDSQRRRTFPFGWGSIHKLLSPLRTARPLKIRTGLDRRITHKARKVRDAIKDRPEAPAKRPGGEFSGARRRHKATRLGGQLQNSIVVTDVR